MRDKLRDDKQQLKKWKLMDEKIKDEHRSYTDQEIANSYKLKVAIIHKE